MKKFISTVFAMTVFAAATAFSVYGGHINSSGVVTCASGHINSSGVCTPLPPDGNRVAVQTEKDDSLFSALLGEFLSEYDPFGLVFD